MLVVMDAAARPEQIEAVLRHIERMGFRAHPIPGAYRTAIGITGHSGKADPQILENFPGVKEIIPVSHAYKLVSREAKPDDTVVSVGGVDIGGRGVVVIGGPCAVESLDQTRTIAEHVKRAGGQLLRGGAYKPRTSPYSFQGLGEEGLEILARVREEFEIPVITEAIDDASLQLIEQYADCIQIGARNMQNFALLRSAGRARKPVLLKRGMAATLEELLLSAEYVMSEGNYGVIFCERGVRTFFGGPGDRADQSPSRAGRPEPRHREEEQGGSDVAGRDRGRCGRRHHRGAPSSRGSALGRPSGAVAGDVRPTRARGRRHRRSPRAVPAAGAERGEISRRGAPMRSAPLHATMQIIRISGSA
jgi:3-deoxy-7-phosphoheptulonate synthase